MFKKSKKGYYFWDEFTKIDGLVHGISTRHFGSIKSNKQINRENLKDFLDVLGIDIKRTVFPEQIYDSSISIIQDLKKRVIHNTDALITKRKNIFLCVVTADCLPVIFYDKKSEMVGIAHAGYKGILKGILRNMVMSFKKLRSDIKDVLVGIGPAIGVCCYDVFYERIKMFERLVNSNDGDSGRALPRLRSGSLGRMTNLYQARNGKYFLDLKNTAKQTLILEGVQEKNIEVSDICTKDNIKNFFSFRGEGPENFGEFVTVVGIV